jgi:hypothetical protein
MTQAARVIASLLLVLALVTTSSGPVAAQAPTARTAANAGATEEGRQPKAETLTATTGHSAGRIGFDISYPQCGGPFPSDAAFGIVGVNRGIAFQPNPCLGAGNGPSELAWAGVNAELYANTGNPGPRLSSRWPIGQSYPRRCSADEPNSLGCAFDYGWNAARDSYVTAVRAYISLGWAPAFAIRTPRANHWWLDVETANSWRKPLRNIAVLEGAVAYLEDAGAASVGFYSAPHMWQEITGGTDAFAAYPSWVAGALTRDGARRRCTGDGFTGGGVELTQYLSNGFDADYRC